MEYCTITVPDINILVYKDGMRIVLSRLRENLRLFMQVDGSTEDMGLTCLNRT